MKVRLLGFHLECKGRTPLSEFEDALVAFGKAKAEIFTWEGHKRVFRCRAKGDLIEGLFLTIKDQKMFPVLTKVQEYQLSVHSLAAGEQLIDFNHFVWSRKTGRGVYQHYHQSPALTRFADFLREEYDKLRERNIADAIVAAGGDRASDAQRRASKKRFAGKLKVNRLLSTAGLKELLDDLDSVDRFQVDFAAFAPDQGSMFDPLKQAVKSQRFTLTFQPEWRASAWLKNAVRLWAANQRIKRGFVEGKEGGSRRRVDLERNYEFYGEFEFEEFAKGIVGELNQWEDGTVLKRMRKVMTDRSDIFLDPEV